MEISRMKFFICILAALFFSQHALAKSSTHLGSGMLIGAASGAGVGLISSLLIAQKYQCNDNQRREGEPCWISTTIIVWGTFGSAAMGTGIGAIIGNKIPKKNVIVAPIVSHDEKSGTFGGLLLNGAF